MTVHVVLLNTMSFREYFIKGTLAKYLYQPVFIFKVLKVGSFPTI